MSTWPPYWPPHRLTVAEVVGHVVADEWQRLSCEEGAQGPRLDDWTYVCLSAASSASPRCTACTFAVLALESEPVDPRP